MKSKLGGFKKSDLTLPLKPFIRMEILSDDSLEIAGRIILILLTAVIVFFVAPHMSSLLAFASEQIGSRFITGWDVAGYAASLLVIAAFCMNDIISLRALAILSNLAFLTYGIGLELEPVWLLHGLLLPLNCWRLRQILYVKKVKAN